MRKIPAAALTALLLAAGAGCSASRPHHGAGTTSTSPAAATPTASPTDDGPVATSYATTADLRDALAGNPVTRCATYRPSPPIHARALGEAICSDNLLLYVYGGTADAESSADEICLTALELVVGPNWLVSVSDGTHAGA